MRTLRAGRSWLLITDPGLTGLRTALFALLGGAGAVLLAVLAGRLRGGAVPATGLVLPGVVGAVGSTLLSGAPVPRPWRTALLIGGAAGTAALVVAILPAGLRGAPTVQVALMTLVTVAAAWSRSRGPVAGAAGLASWLGVAVTLAGAGQTPALVPIALGPVLAGCWLGVLATTVLRPRPEIGLRLTVAGLLAAADRTLDERARRVRTRGGTDPGPGNRARVQVLRLALAADAQLQRGARRDAPTVRLALLALHAAADDVVRSPRSGAADNLRRRAREVRALLRTDRPVAAGTVPALAAGAVLAQGVLPGAKPAEAATSPDGWGARSRLPSADSRHVLRVGLAALLAAVAGSFLSPGHLVWAVLTVFTVLSGPAATATTLTRSLGRVGGTALGLGLGLVVDHALGGRPGLLIVVAVVGIALGFWIQARHYAVAMGAGAVAIAGLYRLLSPDPAPMVALRLVETAVGGASAILVTLLVWPVSAAVVRRSVDHDVSACRREVHLVLDQSPATATDPELELDRLAAAVVREEQAVDAWLRAGPRYEPTAAEISHLLDHVADARRLARPPDHPPPMTRRPQETPHE